MALYMDHGFQNYLKKGIQKTKKNEANIRHLKYIPHAFFKRLTRTSVLDQYARSCSSLIKCIPTFEVLQPNTDSYKHQSTIKFWHKCSEVASTGGFEGKPLVKDLCSLLLQVLNRDSEGRALTNLEHPTILDDFIILIFAFSPKAADIFQRNLAGQSLRSCQ
eukprot:14492707-Ditylum_brightwellii.AAC.1